MKRVLVMFGTTDGHTARVAGVVANALRDEGCEVDVLNAERSALATTAGYDAVIVGASIHAQGYQRAVCHWVRRNAEALNRLPTAFLSVCLGVLEHREHTNRELDRILSGFLADQGWKPAMTKIVAGALPYTRYNWLKKRVMRHIASRTGGGTDISRDYEYTDWDDLRAFARDFAHRHELTAVLEAVGTFHCREDI